MCVKLFNCTYVYKMYAHFYCPIHFQAFYYDQFVMSTDSKLLANSMRMWHISFSIFKFFGIQLWKYRYVPCFVRISDVQFQIRFSYHQKIEWWINFVYLCSIISDEVIRDLTMNLLSMKRHIKRLHSVWFFTWLILIVNSCTNVWINWRTNKTPKLSVEVNFAKLFIK